MTSNIKVAVRVRPLSDREREKGLEPAVLVKEYEGSTKLVVRNTVLKEERSFSFDYVYSSCPECNDAEDRPLDQQRDVYRELGTDMLFGAFDGANTCLLAYGQAGSGKTYSIVGPGGGDSASSGGSPSPVASAHDGLLMRICRQLLKALRPNQQVFLSIVEVYNEKA